MHSGVFVETCLHKDDLSLSTRAEKSVVELPIIARCVPVGPFLFEKMVGCY